MHQFSYVDEECKHTGHIEIRLRTTHAVMTMVKEKRVKKLVDKNMKPVDACRAAAKEMCEEYGVSVSAALVMNNVTRTVREQKQEEFDAAVEATCNMDLTRAFLMDRALTSVMNVNIELKALLGSVIQLHAKDPLCVSRLYTDTGTLNPNFRMLAWASPAMRYVNQFD